VADQAFDRHLGAKPRDVSEDGKKAPLALRPDPFADELACAARLARRLRELAVRRGGEATWVGTRYRLDDDTWTVDAVGPSLFDGVAGILLFLSYVADVTGERRDHELAREALGTLERQLERAADASAPPMAGGFGGAGGWIHALAHVGVLWEDDRLLRRACDLVPMLLRGLHSAPTVDVIGGAAGAIRPLLTLYELTRAEQVLNCALACGEQILEAAQPQTAGVGWFSPAGPVPLTGFAQDVPYPQGYRNWTHVKTMQLKPGHPLYEAFGGIHHTTPISKRSKATARASSCAATGVRSCVALLREAGSHRGSRARV
jgi:hypothetical protein